MDLAWLAAAWVAGMLTARWGTWWGAWAQGCALVALAVSGLCVQRALEHESRTWRLAPWLVTRVLLPVATLLAGLAYGAPHPSHEAPLPPKGLARIEAHVVHVERFADGTARSTLEVISGKRLEDGAAFTRGSLLRAAPFPLPEGARVRLLAKVEPWVPFRNPSPHPEIRRVGASAVATASAWLPAPDAVEVLDHQWLAARIEQARDATRAALLRSLPTAEAAMARALVLGDGHALDDAQQTLVRGAGLSHVLAVSGMHVVIVAGLLWQMLGAVLSWWPWLARRSEPRRVAAAVCVPAVLAFAAFAGGAPSAWRAAVTGALGLILVALGRRPDAVAVTSAAVIGLSAVQPDEVSHPGFLLSVVATAAILSIARDPQHPPSALGLAWSINWRTNLATAPLVLYAFGHVPLPGLLANLVLVPFSSLWLLPSALVHALVATLVPALDGLTGALFGIGARAFEAGCAAFAGLDTAARLAPIDLWQGVLLGVGSCALLLCRRRRTQVLWLATTLVGLGVEEWRLRLVERPVDQLRATFLDVGQGDAALVDLPDGRLMVIDAGGNPGGGVDPGERVLLPLLQARRRDAIDLLVLTHPHPDHYGGLGALLGRVPIREIWDSGQAHAEQDLSGTAAAAAALLDRARALGSRIRTPAELCQRPHVFGSARIHVLAPCPRYESTHDPNDNSIVLRIDLGARRMLFTGDVEAHAEAQLVRESAAQLRADVLKVPHHGSRTSSSAALLTAVRPAIAVVSAGATNTFGHPHPDVSARLAANARQVLGTAEQGGVVVTTDGRSLNARAWSGRGCDFADL